MLPEDLGRLSTIADVRARPTGGAWVFAVSRIDLDEDRYERRLWIWDGHRARPLTHGPGDSSPRWSPDGRRIAFLRKGPSDGDRPQVAVMEADGGEAAVVTDIPLGVEDLEWSPDGSRLVAVGVSWISELADLDDDERKKRARRIRTQPYRFDNRGWLHDRRRHLWLVDPDGGSEPRCLTPGDEFDEGAPAWHPDGERVVFLSARHDRRFFEPGTTIWELAVDDPEAEPTAIAERGSWNHLSFRPDGVLHAIGNPDPDAWPDIFSLLRREGDGWVDLTRHLDRSVWALWGMAGPVGPRWIGEDAVLLLEERGRMEVVRVHPDGVVDHLIAGERVVAGADPDPADGRIAFIASDPTTPPEVYLWHPDGAEARLTDINAELAANGHLVAPQHAAVVSDGEDVDVWVYLPPDHDGGPVPLLLNIHGGPAAQYGWGFFDEFQVYARAGFGVVASNPRGSSGRGRDWLRAVVGDGWGTVDLADVRAVVDQTLERHPELDPARLGIMGGSYGGFLTAWTIAHDARFSSAIVERGLLTWESFAGTSDIGGTFHRYYLGVDLPEGWAVLHEKSPLAHAHRTTTPTLVLHAEQDHRCPIEQAEQYFTALRRAGVTTEFVRFPDEGHELSRSGSPRHRRERFEIVLDWHGRYLAGAEEG